VTDVCLSVWMSVCQTSFKSLLLLQLLSILTKFVTYNLCANTPKIVEPIFEILIFRVRMPPRKSDFKIFGEFFLNFKFGLVSENSSNLLFWISFSLSG